MRKGFALVTGASSGIGKAIAVELYKQQFPLLLVSHQEIELKKTVEEIKTTVGADVLYFCLDLSKPSSSFQLFEYCQLNGIEVQVLVNNAGILIYGEVAETDISRIECILNLHIHTPILLCRYFLPELKKREVSYILNVSSISSVMPYPNISLYGPTKTMLRSFTKALRFECSNTSVVVSCLIPGATATSLYNPDKVDLKLALKTGIMKTPDEVATQAVYGLLKKKAEIIPGFLNQIIVALTPLVPSFFIKWLFSNTSLPQKLKKMLNA